MVRPFIIFIRSEPAPWPVHAAPEVVWALIAISLVSLPLAISVSETYPAIFLLISVSWLVSPMFFVSNKPLFNFCLGHSVFFVVLYVRILAISLVKLVGPGQLVLHHLEQALGLVVLLVLVRRFFSFQMVRMTRRSVGRSVMFGMAIGLPFGVVDHLSGERTVSVPSLAMPQSLAWIATLSLLVGMVEEVLFRGVFYQSARDVIGPRRASVFQALLFGFVHYPNPLSAIIAAIVFGIVMTLLVERTGNIFGPVTAHFSNNTVWMALSRLAYWPC